MNTTCAITTDSRGVVIWLELPRNLYNQITAPEDYDGGEECEHGQVWCKAITDKKSNLLLVFYTHEHPARTTNKFHSGKPVCICPVCNTQKAYVHLPHLAELNGNSFEENMAIAIKLNIPNMRACWGCFHSIWQGEA